ncbi:lycopene cyclase domain-containing protein [Conyzicola lurida]|uniref:Lycopene cyclase domain-containing protein n=1 Tax=Conyzicola lurida TaxID=1172621 RepID=A0A841AUD3_9MICO|nr:lycopene cyclase domain-containing protein [Conyzicola lurida]MBB5845019.1 lycopene cyclase domain-containing protein [Conyzicola lurida]
MGLLYLVALLVALTGMVMLDRRFTLFFWADARRAAVVLVSGLVFFVLWDLAGIGLGIFFRGETDFMTGIQVAPELPVEELFFLALLVYVTMDLYGFACRSLSLSKRGLRLSGPAKPSSTSNTSSPSASSEDGAR